MRRDCQPRRQYLHFTCSKILANQLKLVAGKANYGERPWLSNLGSRLVCLIEKEGVEPLAAKSATKIRARFTRPWQIGFQALRTGEQTDFADRRTCHGAKCRSNSEPIEQWQIGRG